MNPRSKEDNAQVRKEAEENLVEAALKIFASQGYAATSMADIAKAAGVAKGLTYHYFKNKEALLVALAEKRLLQWLPLVEGLESIKDSFKRLSFLVTFVLDELVAKTDELRFFNTLYLSVDGVGAIEKAMKKYKSQFERLFIAEGKIFAGLGLKNPELEATFLRSALQGISLEYMLSLEYPLKEIKEMLLARYEKART